MQMLFNSVSFLFLFLPVVLLLYHGIDRFRFRGKDLTLNLLLVVFSLVFFCWGGFKVAVKTVPALISIVVWNYLLALLSQKWKPFLIIGVVGNLAFFFYYKIWNEFAKLIDGLLSSNLTIDKLVIPIGLSFILFHGISYLLDIRNGKAKPNKNFAEFALYMLFFPKLAQGPIVKYYEFAPYFHNRKVGFEDLVAGLERFIVGLAKKVLIADVFALTVNRIFVGGGVDAPSLWIGIVLFSMQLYLDFSGYSDMAIGIGKMFGFKIPENFNFPYSSTSVSEFWRRWHISLGAWFKEYLYIPLGGSRKGNVYLNLIIVFLAVGIWHGSSLLFLLWGLTHGFCVAMEKFLIKKGWFDKIPKLIRWVYTIFIVNIIRLVYKVPDLDTLLQHLKCMFGMGGIQEELNFSWLYFLSNRILLLSLISIVGMMVFGNTRVQNRLRQWDKESVGFSIGKYVLLTGLFLLSVCAIMTSKYQPFLYFQF